MDPDQSRSFALMPPSGRKPEKMTLIRDSKPSSFALPRRNTLKLLGGGALAAGLALPGGSARAQAAEPQRGGTLRIGLSGGSTTETLDPATYLDSHMWVVGFALGNNLVEIGPDRSLIPELAESWEGSGDARRWVFKIRQGVQFHNGKTLTPADVVYSLNRHIGPETMSAAKGFLEGISSIRADGDTVIVEHETGDADIPMIMGDFHLQIVPEGHDDWTTFIGTGPYVLEAFEPGVRFFGVRNENYWKEQRAWVDEVEIQFIVDAAARTNALLSGEIDVMDRFDSKMVKRLQSLDSFQLIEGIGGRYETAVMDVRKAPFDDLHVREALKYAVMRQEIVDKVFDGFAALGNDHPIPPTDPFHHSELPQRPYDPDKAQWHLKQAGLDSVEVQLSTADAAFPGAVDVATLMQERAKGTGVTIDVLREANDGYWSNVWMQKPFVMSNWTTRPTPGMMFSVAFACQSSWNEAYWCNQHLEQLLKAGKTETDFAKRKQIYWDMQQLVHSEGGNNIFAFPSDLDVYDKRVQGTAPDSINRLMGARIAERVWLA